MNGKEKSTPIKIFKVLHIYNEILLRHKIEGNSICNTMNETWEYYAIQNKSAKEPQVL